MTQAQANGISIEYDAFGSPSDTPLLLVMGLGAQMIAWDERFCGRLAGLGFYVVRYDNRDTGLSTWFSQAGAPDLATAMGGGAAGAPAYTLDDMADDAAGLLDALGIAAAHVVGASMGGMIAQLIAIRHPARVLSLTSIMSSAGGPTMVAPWADALAVLAAPPATTREAAIEGSVKSGRVLSGGGFPFDEQKARDGAAAAWDRANNPDGVARQLHAILSHPGRVEGLGQLAMPVLVVHGDKDALVPVENGRITAAAVPGSELVEIPGMGHELPEGAWDAVVDAIAAVTAKAPARA